MKKKIKKIIKDIYYLLFKGYHIVPDYYGRAAGKQVDLKKIKGFSELANKVIKDDTTCLYYDRLYTVFNILNTLEKNQKLNKGYSFLEAGVYKGGTSFFIASMLKKMGVKCNFYCVDTYEGHSEGDLKKTINDGVHKYGMFQETSYEFVKKYLSEFENVQVIKNKIQDVSENIIDDKYFFIHLDMDIYLPTKFGLETFSKQVVNGGIILIDDYGFKSCPGAKKAVDEFCLKNKNFVKIPLMTGQCILIKVEK